MMLIDVCYTWLSRKSGLGLSPKHKHPAKEISTYFSSSFSLPTSKVSSHPTSIKTLTPPSSSRRDCDAADSDCAPSNEQKVNIVNEIQVLACCLCLRFNTSKLLVIWCIAYSSDYYSVIFSRLSVDGDVNSGVLTVASSGSK